MGISPNKNSMTSIYDFYDVHLLGPYTLAVPVFYRPVWFCVKTMKLRHTMSPAPPPKKTMQSLNIENWFLISIPPEEYAPHITQIWLEKKWKPRTKQYLAFCGPVLRPCWWHIQIILGAGADWGLRNSEDTKLIHNPPNPGSYTKMHSECTPRCYCNLLPLRLCIGGRSTQEYKGNAFGPRTTPNALRGATSLLLLRLCVGGRSTQVYIQSNGK